MILVFWRLSFKPTFSLSSFTFIKRLFSSSSLSAIRVVSSAYLRLLIFLQEILITACASSSPAFLMMYSAYKLNKQGNINQYHNEVSPHTSQSVYYWKDKRQQMLLKIWRKENTGTLEMETVSATMENSMEQPQEIKNRTTIGFSNHSSRCISKGNKIIISKRYLNSVFIVALFIITNLWKWPKCQDCYKKKVMSVCMCMCVCTCTHPCMWYILVIFRRSVNLGKVAVFSQGQCLESESAVRHQLSILPAIRTNALVLIWVV